MVVHVLEPLTLRLPFWRYFGALRHLPHAFLLDSAQGEGPSAGHSFMGADPFLVFRARRLPEPGPGGGPRSGHITVIDRRSCPERVTEHVGDPLLSLRRLLDEHRVDPSLYEGRVAPLLAGAVGYLGYEAGHFIESLPDTGQDDLKLPDIELGFFDATLVHCHATGSSYISSMGRDPDPKIADSLARKASLAVRRRVLEFEEAHFGPGLKPGATTSHCGRHSKPAGRAHHGPASEDPLREEPGAASGFNYLFQREDVAPGFNPGPMGSKWTHVSREAYGRLVRRAKEHIEEGDVFEVCLTHRIEAPFAGDPWDLYQELRRVNPAPFAFYMALPEATLVSSSPERFLRLSGQGELESRPIKGTRPRGRTLAEDLELAKDLEESPKDRAENTMIVDLVRSDFGKVCGFGTIEVSELCVVERHATVHQLVSTIRGRLLPGRGAIDVISACFPGGSMTGAPKVEAMKIIDSLEPVSRGVYSGAAGYLDFTGAMDLAIVIRTAVVCGGVAHIGVGGAVVSDSDPDDEFQESMDKARALLLALGGAP